MDSSIGRFEERTLCDFRFALKCSMLTVAEQSVAAKRDVQRISVAHMFGPGLSAEETSVCSQRRVSIADQSAQSLISLLL